MGGLGSPIFYPYISINKMIKMDNKWNVLVLILSVTLSVTVSFWWLLLLLLLED